MERQELLKTFDNCREPDACIMDITLSTEKTGEHSKRVE